ncbi:hypothetical protein E1A91_A12G002800v1 [Gossypium mustelinum]|uniref:Uncharacterized protein n=2 Tax=Gossypium TaxID=3633 RepID=A0A5D2WNC9_GOSMU|nr:hypothetical protein ES288_A12G002500v1 [Gossypium darwinii]TYJ03069.1 hypothetical protein E1A91_A12G002800v1 [Gossypium mustelinum]
MEEYPASFPCVISSYVYKYKVGYFLVMQVPKEKSAREKVMLRQPHSFLLGAQYFPTELFKDFNPILQSQKKRRQS